MRTILFAGAVLLVSSGSLEVRTAPAAAPAAASVDDAMRAFWEADSPTEAEKRAAKVVAAGGAFDDLLSRLKVGRPYGAERSGRVELPTTVRLQHLDNVAEAVVSIFAVLKAGAVFMPVNPQTKADLTGIRQPLVDLKNRCGSAPAPAACRRP